MTFENNICKQKYIFYLYNLVEKPCNISRYIEICVLIEFNDYKMFHRQIRFKNIYYYFMDSQMPRILSFVSTLHFWTFGFLNNSIIGFYFLHFQYFWTFGFLSSLLWIEKRETCNFFFRQRFLRQQVQGRQ